MYTTIGEKRNAKQAIIGCTITLVATVAVYFIFRYVTKMLLKLGRNGALPIFKSSTATACVALVIVTLFTILISITVGKKLKTKDYGKICNLGIITFATVLFLYIIFKQFFLVALAPGFINY